MAQKTTVTYVDDLTGDEIKDGKGGPVEFGFDGAIFTVDLSDKSRRDLEKALAPYLEVATPVRKSNSRAPKRGSNGSGLGDAAKVRAWAKENGHEVPERGRIPASIREAYAAAT